LRYQTSHDNVSVVRTTFKVYGKRQNLTLSQPKTPKPIITNLNGVIMSLTLTTKKLGLIRIRVFVHHIGEIYTPPVRNLLHFFGSSTRLQASPSNRFLRSIRQMTRFCAAFLLL